jgi:hypothetical protein
MKQASSSPARGYLAAWIALMMGPASGTFSANSFPHGRDELPEGFAIRFGDLHSFRLHLFGRLGRDFEVKLAIVDLERLARRVENGLLHVRGLRLEELV